MLWFAPSQGVLEVWVIFITLSTEVSGSKGKVPIVSNHHMIEGGAQEAAIGAFLLAHEGHTQDVEVQRGTWSIFCRCARCEEIHTYEVDNEARERALRLPMWQLVKLHDARAKGEHEPMEEISSSERWQANE